MKRDDAEALRVLLSAADEDEASLPSGARGLRWPDWKDRRHLGIPRRGISSEPLLQRRPVVGARRFVQCLAS